MPHHVIDVAPLRAEYGELVLGEDSQTTAEDLVDWLRERRVLAAVAPAGDGRIVFSVGGSPAGRVQVLDGDGRAGDGVELGALRDDLRRSGLGVDVGLGDSGYVVDESDDVEASLPDHLAEPVYEVSDEGLVPADEVEWPEEQAYQVWEFSHRGPGWADIDVLLNRGQVTVAADGAWSAIGYEDPGSARTRIDLPLDLGELPLIKLYLAERPMLGTVPGWVEVTSRERRHFGGHFLTVEPPRLATFEPNGLDDGPARLVRVLVNPELEPDSAANQLVADESVSVDATALHEAMRPSDQDPRRRLGGIALALGVPAPLVGLAIDGASAPNQRVIAPKGWLAHLADIADGGTAAIAPLSRDLNAIERSEQWLRRRPAAAMGLAGAEVALGAVALRRGLESRGAKRWVGLAAAVALLGDGAIDCALAARRARSTSLDDHYEHGIGRRRAEHRDQ